METSSPDEVSRMHREVEDRTVTLRRLGEKATQVISLDEVTAALSAEATPPDLRQK